MNPTGRLTLKKEGGFTLIELMAMLVIIGVITSIAVKKFTNISANAEKQAILAGIAELNVRETLHWANHLISNGGYGSDEPIWSAMDPHLGPGYKWMLGPTPLGGEISFGSQTETLIRSASTQTSAAIWSGT
jgi:prepilin-type N-terminal cleavage/methylation domain-containing protein